MEFPMNLHCKFMYYSIRIPWNSPYGFHGRIHMKFCGKTTNCVVKNSVNIKNRTVDSTTRHVHGRRCVLTAEPYDCCKSPHCPLLIVLWVGHAQSERRQTLMLDLGAINNPQRSFSTTTIIQEARPTTPTTQRHLTVMMPNVVTVHSKSSLPSSLLTHIPGATSLTATWRPDDERRIRIHRSSSSDRPDNNDDCPNNNIRPKTNTNGRPHTQKRLPPPRKPPAPTNGNQVPHRRQRRGTQTTNDDMTPR